MIVKTTRELLYPKPMNIIESDRLAMFSSLLQAINEAGGDVTMIKKHIGAGMTVLELIDTLGQNGIRFIFCPTLGCKSHEVY